MRAKPGNISFKGVERPQVKKRGERRPAGRQTSTSSDEMGGPPIPPPPRPQRKHINKRKVQGGLYRKKDNAQVEVYHIGFARDSQGASTPENTSLSSSNSSVLPSSHEQSSSESLFRRRDSRLEQRARGVLRARAMPRLEETLQHDRSEWSTLIGPDPSRYCALIG